MLSAIKIYLIDRKLFWILKKSFQSYKNSIISYWFNKSDDNINSFSKLIWTSLKTISIALLFCVVLYLTDHGMLHIIKSEWVGLLALESDNYITFLATVAGIGGVFIALYFNALSAIASSVYSKVPNDIRSLLKRDEVGKTYMLLVTIVTLSSIILISIHLLGGPALKLAVVEIVILAAFSITAFYGLGIKAFNFFDPTSLSNVLFKDIFKSINNVSVKSRFCRYKIVQEKQYLSARENLTSITKLIDICKKEEHLRNKPLSHLSLKLNTILEGHLIAKGFIPLESEWYETKYEQKEWFKSSFSELGIALSTGTAIQPKKVKHYWWLEDEIHRILTGVFEFYMKHENYEAALQIINNLGNSYGRLGGISELERGLSYWNDLVSVFERNISEERVEVIGIAEHLYTFPIYLLLGYVKYGIQYSRTDTVGEFVDEIDWKNKRRNSDTYKPFYLLERLDWLKNTIQNELFIEGKIITPKWYQIELIIQESVFKLDKNVKALLFTPKSIFKKSIEKFLAEKHHWLTSSVLSRQMEFQSKLEAHLSSIFDVYEKATSERHLEDLPWTELDRDQIFSPLDESRKKLNDKLVSVINELSLKEKPQDYPDYAGQFLNVLIEELFEALLNNEDEKFENTFISLFDALIRKHIQLKPKPDTPKWKLENELRISAAPLLDLIDLSGYGLLFSKFYRNNKFWVVVKDKWDNHLKTHTKERLEYISGHIFITHSRFSLTESGVKLTNRKQRVSQFLNKIDRIEVESSSHFLKHRKIPNHEDEFIRAFTPNESSMSVSMYDGIDIFIELYLAKFKDYFDDLEFGNKGKGRLKKAIRIDKENNQKYFENEDEDDD